TEGTAGACDMVVAQNVFTATDHDVEHAWDGGRGSVLSGNVFVRDLSLGAGHAFSVEDFGNGGTAALSHGIRDAVSAEDVGVVTQYDAAQAFDTVRQWTVVVDATDGGGAPVAGANVTVADEDGVGACLGAAGA